MKRTRSRWRLPSVPTGAVVAHARGDGQPVGGAAIGEMARNFGAEPAGGARANAFDLAEPLDVGLELGRGLEVADDLGLDALDFLFQRPGQAGEAFGDEVSGGGFAAVALGPEQGLEVGEAAHQFAQELLGGPGGLPAITNTEGNTNSFIKTGDGLTNIATASNFTGTTTITNGTLEVSSALTATAQVTVNTGGMLLLSNATANMIDNAAAFDLNSGEIVLGGASSLDETVGTLTLSADSIIDFGTLGHTFRFADSSSNALETAWTGTTLSIYNWTNGADHLFFGDGTGTGLQQSQLDKIKFYSEAGMTILPYAPGFAAFSGSLDEVVLVPEPSSVATVPGLLGLIAWRERRQVLPHENHEALTVMAARRT